MQKFEESFTALRDGGDDVLVSTVGPFNRLGREGSAIEGTGLGQALCRLILDQMNEAETQRRSRPSGDESSESALRDIETAIDELAELRSRVADEMGAVLVPHQVRVNAQFFDCAQPAEQTCIAGMKAMVNNNYAGAVQAFSDAHAQLVQAHAVPNEVAKPLWNRGLVYKYSREFDKAAADIRQSCGIESRLACDGELRDIATGRQAVERW